jgi:hypothetical protein
MAAPDYAFRRVFEKVGRYIGENELEDFKEYFNNQKKLVYSMNILYNIIDGWKRLIYQVAEKMNIYSFIYLVLFITALITHSQNSVRKNKCV